MTSLSLHAANSPVSVPPLSPAPLVVRPFESQDAERWDRFVMDQPVGTFFHQMAWKRVVEKTFDHQAQYVYGERDGRIVAIAPVFMVSNWMVGRCLISSPLASYGGICAEDLEAENALLSFLKRRAQEQQVDYLELRNAAGGTLPEFVPNPRYSSFSTTLSKDPEAVLKGLPKDIRYMIRKAEKADLHVRRGPELLDEFYRLFAINMRRLGTPVFPRSLFVNLVQEFGNQFDVLVVYQA